MFAEHYASLIAGQWPAIDPETAFDQHVLACVLSLARDEALAGRCTLSKSTGLASRSLLRLTATSFPVASFDLVELDPAGKEPERTEEEELLLALLLQHADRRLEKSAYFARILARRSMRDDHLWQDLGLFERAELTRLMHRHFPTLAQGNTENMRWKKYFYRKLCEAEGFSLCTAPSCRDCTDFTSCFGEETGESRLARLKNGIAAAG